MFRRKEDSLFDTDTDTTDEATGETGSASAPQSSAPAPSSPSSSSASAYSNLPGASSPLSSQPARTLPEARPVSAAASASSFRPSSAAPISSDMSRNRMPEAKPASAPLSSTAPSSKASPRILTVGNDILLKGEIATCDRLVIEGKVDATLNDVHTVEIAETGSFKGSAHIEDAEISGLFEGDLIVRGRLVIYATGKVRGKISYGEIEIQRGGELSGEIKLGGQSTAASSRSARPASAPAKEAAAA